MNLDRQFRAMDHLVIPSGFGQQACQMAAELTRSAVSYRRVPFRAGRVNPLDIYRR